MLVSLVPVFVAVAALWATGATNPCFSCAGRCDGKITYWINCVWQVVFTAAIVCGVYFGWVLFHAAFVDTGDDGEIVENDDPWTIDDANESDDSTNGVLVDMFEQFAIKRTQTWACIYVVLAAHAITWPFFVYWFIFALGGTRAPR